MTLDITSQSFH